MGQAHPFSKIDHYLQALGKGVSGCLVDTQFLVAAVEDHHPFHEDAEFLFEKLAEYKVPIFSTVTSRSEFIDYMRRTLITEALMGMLSEGAKWKISESVRTKLRAQRLWLAREASDGRVPVLTDYRIKECKAEFMPRTQSGQIGWVEFCGEFLSGRLLSAWTVLVENLQLNYLDVRSNQDLSYFEKPLAWERMYSISEATCLSASDSMLVNVLLSSTFPFIVSADYDISYAVLASELPKTALLPDSLYRRKVKGLRFPGH